VALPYADGGFRALLVLPSDDTPSGLSALASAPGGGALRALREQLSERRVALSLPRFKLEYGVASLQKPLRAMGLGPAFTASRAENGPRGGFSLMSDDPDVHLSDVLHKALVEVTEEGTVAAAARAAVMMTRSIAINPPTERVVFDRPFVMAIEEAATGAPLFLGTVVHPRFT
jgi:serpin B